MKLNPWCFLISPEPRLVTASHQENRYEASFPCVYNLSSMMLRKMAVGEKKGVFLIRELTGHVQPFCPESSLSVKKNQKTRLSPLTQINTDRQEGRQNSWLAPMAASSKHTKHFWPSRT